MKMITQIASLIFGVVANTSIAATGTGVYHYGPDVSENYACGKAEMIAKLDAIRSVVGENIFADEFSQCTDRKGEIKCANDMAMYSATDAYITRVKNVHRSVESYADRRICTVDVDVKVTKDTPKIDAYVRGRFLYKSGDDIRYLVSSNEPVKVYMFHVEGNKATMMWPLYVGTNNKVANELIIPTQGYKLTAHAGKDKFAESLVFVFTNEKIDFIRDYDVEDLNNKLMTIPISERRIIRRNLIIEQ